MKDFAVQVKRNISKMRRIYEIDADVWLAYLATFPNDPIYLVNRVHDCRCCEKFVKAVGGLVSIDQDLKIHTIWDDIVGEYAENARIMREFVLNQPIVRIAGLQESDIGVRVNVGKNDVLHHHFWAQIPHDQAQRDIDGLRRDLLVLSSRGLRECIELISSGQVYRGESWLGRLTALLDVKGSSDLALWYFGYDYLEIRNTSIGKLIQDLGEGRENALAAYERITAPEHYRRPTPKVTPATLAAAAKTIQDLGLTDSMPHRFANIGDVKDFLFVDRSKVEENIFSELARSCPVKEPRGPDITMDELLKAKHIDVYVTRDLGFVSLLAPVNPEAESLFQWPNNFGWAYAGNLTDMSKLVQQYGGKVEGELRFSISWHNENDMDAHANDRDAHIFYANKRSRLGELDVDIIHPGPKGAVENIIWQRCPPDVDLWVECYTDRGGTGPTRVEVECKGELFEGDWAGVVIKIRNGKIQGHVGRLSDVWGLPCNTWQPVTAIMNSPNSTGLRHTFFFIRGCVNPEQPNSFFNEFLKPELHKHRRVFELVGSNMKVLPMDDQLSGVSRPKLVRVDGKIRKLV